MTLDDIFNQLSFGELSQISIGNSDAGLVGMPDRLRVAASVELALAALYKRFLIKEGTVIVEMIDGLNTYVLDNKYSENSVEVVPYKYIKDATNPFTNDVIKVERIYDESGLELALNVIDDPYAIRTPNLKTLVVPPDLKTSLLTVMYRASHPKFDRGLVVTSPEEVEIEMPMSYLEALLFYVAARITTPVGMTSEFHDGNNYMAKYEAACSELEAQNIRVDTLGTNDRLVRNGWV